MILLRFLHISSLCSFLGFRAFRVANHPRKSERFPSKQTGPVSRTWNAEAEAWDQFRTATLRLVAELLGICGILQRNMELIWAWDSLGDISVRIISGICQKDEHVRGCKRRRGRSIASLKVFQNVLCGVPCFKMPSIAGRCLIFCVWCVTRRAIWVHHGSPFKRLNPDWLCLVAALLSAIDLTCQYMLHPDFVGFSPSIYRWRLLYRYHNHCRFINQKLVCTCPPDGSVGRQVPNCYGTHHPISKKQAMEPLWTNHLVYSKTM